MYVSKNGLKWHEKVCDRSGEVRWRGRSNQKTSRGEEHGKELQHMADDTRAAEIAHWAEEIGLIYLQSEDWKRKGHRMESHRD
jgi:hypothetical protein